MNFDFVNFVLQIRNAGYKNDKCFDAGDTVEQPLQLFGCHKRGGNQYWEYNKGQICRFEICVHYIDNMVVTKIQTEELEKVVRSPHDLPQISVAISVLVLVHLVIS